MKMDMRPQHVILRCERDENRSFPQIYEQSWGFLYFLGENLYLLYLYTISTYSIYISRDFANAAGKDRGQPVTSLALQNC